MTDGVKADPEHLRQLATRLHQAASALDGVIGSVPPMPEVTTSSEKVSYTVSEIMKAAGALMTGVGETADKVHESDGSYGEIDNRNAEDIGRVPKSTG